MKRILFLLVYFFTWVVFFELGRIFFLLTTSQAALHTPSQLIFQSLWYGVKMDLSMAAYITILPCLFVLAGLFIPLFREKRIYVIYTGIILFIQLLLIIADAEIYKAWGVRLDFTPLKYLANPKEVWASISHLPLIWILSGFLLVYFLLLWIFNRIINRSIGLLQVRRFKLVQLVIVLLFTGLLIIPVRGGVQLSPLNQSSVFFSNNQYANNAALNASWNFMYSVTMMNQLKENPYEYLNEQEASDKTRVLFETGNKTEQVVTITDTAMPNVVLIVWESFTEKVLDMQLEGKFIIPEFRKWRKEGIYFSNCYSSGDRTDKGISAVLSSYPALPKGSIVNYPEKTSKLPGLGKIFLDNRYTTSFYYGGEPEFANIKSYLTAQDFQHFTTKSDFKKEDMNSKWGAHDDVVVKKILEDLPGLKQPFFTTWLSLSSHEPFETSARLFFKGKDKQSKFLNSLHFSDSVIFYFINELKKLPSWNNTLVIISADHGHYLPITGKKADDFRIPVLWLGGALKKQNALVKKTVSQLDIAGSLIQQMGFSQNPFPFSKNLFDSSSGHWAFFTFNDGIGFVTDSSRLLFDNTGRRVVFEEGKTNPAMVTISKALMQVVYADFLRR
ncbi:MAG TPA: sulfatase-like hydrolase/transferase [Chitinophagaceae bacterium]|nr:sulfatase-like hydrolase/transferase [Chitinophagaceae bacterium]